MMIIITWSRTNNSPGTIFYSAKSMKKTSIWLNKIFFLSQKCCKNDDLDKLNGDFYDNIGCRLNSFVLSKR
jgi:hypothetical protein